MSDVAFPRTTQRLHPKTWLVFGLTGLALSLAPFPMGWRLVLLAVQILLLFWSGHIRSYLFFLCAGLIPVATTSWLVQTISRGGGTVFFSWSPFSWITFEISSGGIATGLLFAIQILNFGTACAIASLTSTPSGIRSALTSWKLPPRIIYLIVASLNAPQQLSRYAHIAQEAGRARGISDKKLRSRIWLRIRTLSTLFTLILMEFQDRGRTLINRGVEKSGPRTFLRTFTDSLTQKILRLTVPLLALTLILLKYTGVL